MTSTSSKTRLQLVAVSAALALGAAACGGSSGGGGGGSGSKASATGVTATTVTIGSHQPLTGPAAPGYSEIAPAAEAMFKYINDGGGIHGRTIQYKYKDDGYNPANTVDVVKQLVLQDKVFAIFNGLGTPTHSKVTDYLNQARVPDLFVASGARLWDDPKKHPYTFGWQPDYLIEGKILGKYIKDNFAGKKVGYLYQNDDFGKDGVAGLDSQLDASTVVDKQPYETSQLAQPTGIAPQLTTLQKKGAQVIVSFSIPAATAVALLTNAKFKYQPQMVVSNVGSDPTTLTGLLGKFSKGAVGAQLLNGMVSDTYLPLTSDTSDPWIALFKKIHDKYIPTLPFDGNVEYGMSAAYTFAQALDAAGDNPTRQSLIDAVEKGGFKGPGVVPFRFSKDSHAGYTGVRIVQLDGKGGATFKSDASVTTDDASASIDAAPTGAQGKPGDDAFLKP
ncbi:MAG: branched-chain amino acid transport system substrate-binding protein [Thermoleophilaceae bacterium]|jgi:ABC-type branched-subunit amino acid transport system substrate-binding protein|nr:branched-chain amino acid transport system substrate-binding protein [Actinomycetota bacterium]MEA2484722.1 branched-chain amino acid transport system substrate-binding protein [Thermoleophilaceae bacterium]